MDEEKGTSLTRRELEAVIKRASELATTDPEGGEGALDEGELFRITREVGLPDSHVRRALSELRTAEDPEGVVARWSGSVTIRVSRVVGGDRERLRAITDEFLVAGYLLQPVRQGSDVLLYRPTVDWISNFARAGASMSKSVCWAAAKEVDGETTLVELAVDPGIRADYTGGAIFGGAWCGDCGRLRDYRHFRVCTGCLTGGPLVPRFDGGWGGGARGGKGRVSLFAEASRRGQTRTRRYSRPAGTQGRSFTTSRVMETVGHATGQEVQSRAVG